MFLSGKSIDFLTFNCSTFHIVYVINHIYYRLRRFVTELFCDRTIWCNLGWKGIIFFFVICKAKIFSIFISFISIFIINFDGDLNSSSSVLLFLYSYNSCIIPTSKRINNVNQVSDFDIFSPWEGCTFRLINCDLIWVSLNLFWPIFIIQIIGDKNVSLIDFENSSMSPEIFLTIIGKFNDIDFASFFEKFFKVVVLFRKVQIRLNYCRIYLLFMLELIIGFIVKLIRKDRLNNFNKLRNFIKEVNINW